MSQIQYKDNTKSQIQQKNESQISISEQKQLKNDKNKKPCFSFIYGQQGEDSQLISFSLTSIEQLVLNKIEDLAKIIAQVLAIETFKKYHNQIKGLSLYILQNQISEQRRDFNILEEDCLKNGNQQQLLLAKEEFKKYLKILEDFLQNQEYKLLFQNILQPQPSQSTILFEPEKRYLDALDNYHYQSTINFHHSLKNDKTGQDLFQKLQTYQIELKKFLYFDLIEQGIKHLDCLLNFILILKTQNNHYALQLLNDFIQQLRTYDDKNKLIDEIELIIEVFLELSEYFQELLNCIKNDKLTFNGKIELNNQQFEIIMLIQDSIIHRKRALNIQLSEPTKYVMQQLKWIYKVGQFETIIKQFKDLQKYIIQNFNTQLIFELEFIKELFISTKLRLLMEMILLMNVLQHNDINLQYFNFQILLYHDQEIINDCAQQNEGNFQNDIHEPSGSINLMNMQQALLLFSNICQQTAIYEIDPKKKMSNDFLEELNIKLKESIQTLVREVHSGHTIIKLSILLNSIFLFQKLNIKIFAILYPYFLELQTLGNQELKKKQILDIPHQVPNLYQLLIAFQQEGNKQIQFKNKVNEFAENFFDDQKTDFIDLIKELEQFDSKKKQNLLQNSKQYYAKCFKEHLLNLAKIGTKSYEEATQFLISQVDP
ncbi:unnamed protein product [Paramecium sonneborni]|uniref:Uncharacterized protein n=1 Tax=Paramecium sonneborni TaxID=65129 RepID=A0A8S1R9W7_9CILI|nr:unnamed protein product [Paramecium sonneborni]